MEFKRSCMSGIPYISHLSCVCFFHTGLTGKIINYILDGGFEISALQMVRLHTSNRGPKYFIPVI